MDFNDYQKLADRTSGANDGVTFGEPVPWKDYLQCFKGWQGPGIPYDPVEVCKQARGEKRLMVACMGLTGEAGETTDYLKKVVAHGHTLDKNKVIKEAGDVLWYVAELCSSLGLSMQDVAEKNIEKLQARYPMGFSQTASINRKD